ncbi:hypothetical protein GZH47_33295 (plasmid) [Paenibacillus rhizovicinus]|uniref:Uncharacterized protein n=1 Tax=Paenibacillus rhizovicinus TaxID=2704463 RepID=A0A6C0PBJ6_9BACL|nr:hypothetical protein [Paenibacillus rhizovicinus]QHW35771.1 hypothetical protein GZH47_33295 [Paenibacillus rhizovicinus]
MYLDRTEQHRRDLKHLIYEDPSKLRTMLQDITDKINMLSDKLEVVTDLYGDALAFQRRLTNEERRKEANMDLVEKYLRGGMRHGRVQT